MRKIDLDKLSGKDLIDQTTLATAFESYLVRTQGYSKEEASFVAICDFKDPYDAMFVLQDYEGRFVVDGRAFEVRSCRTDFCACGLYHLSDKIPFQFYMFIDLDTLKDQTVGSYRNANKLFLL